MVGIGWCGGRHTVYTQAVITGECFSNNMSSNLPSSIMLSPEMGRIGWVICVQMFSTIIWYNSLLPNSKMHLPFEN